MIKNSDKPDSPARMAWKKASPVVAVVLLLLAIATAYLQFSPRHYTEPVRNVWAYDLTTGKPMVVSAANLPPFSVAGSKSKDGSPTAVWASVFACGSCDIEMDRFVGWLQTFTPEQRDRLAPFMGSGRFDDVSDLPEGVYDRQQHFIASPQSPKQWFPIDSEQASDIQREGLARCKMSKPTRCTPRGNAALIDASAIIQTGELQTPGVNLSGETPADEKSEPDSAPDVKPTVAEKPSPDG